MYKYSGQETLVILDIYGNEVATDFTRESCFCLMRKAKAIQGKLQGVPS